MHPQPSGASFEHKKLGAQVWKVFHMQTAQSNTYSMTVTFGRVITLEECDGLQRISCTLMYVISVCECFYTVWLVTQVL